MLPSPFSYWPKIQPTIASDDPQSGLQLAKFRSVAIAEDFYLKRRARLQ
jgi:hypothetical protein